MKIREVLITLLCLILVIGLCPVTTFLGLLVFEGIRNAQGEGVALSMSQWTLIATVALWPFVALVSSRDVIAAIPVSFAQGLATLLAYKATEAIVALDYGRIAVFEPRGNHYRIGTEPGVIFFAFTLVLIVFFCALWTYHLPSSD